MESTESSESMECGKISIANGLVAQVLVFAERKATVDRLERMLRNRRVPALAIHGDKTQLQRDTTIRRSAGSCL